ncbi:MAG TPA: hypothetical protein VNE63_13910 [Candidatus Acidoferrales bacterium]|nr:hypothetical protein [Candidatus Acidoferrales bacterium]
MALFALIVVGVVVAQTWLDWRDTREKWVLPDWAKGTALAGVIAVSLAALTSFASVWIQDSAGQSETGFQSGYFWPELAFLMCMMAAIVFAVRRQRIRVMLLLALVVVTVFWFGISLLS